MIWFSGASQPEAPPYYFVLKSNFVVKFYVIAKVFLILPLFSGV